MPFPLPDDLPHSDADWTGDHWQVLLHGLVAGGLVSYQQLTAYVLGGLNPPQVGTSLTTFSFQQVYGKGKTMSAVMAWFYAQSGTCACGTRLDLQADHIEPRLDLQEAADTLPNMQLLCRRCNVVRRKSHQKGGITLLTTQAALMWILFVRRPLTYKDYERECRAYGLTMANIRFREGWAMAQWLHREGKYDLAPGEEFGTVKNIY